jgi:hypothetical protein
MHLNKTGPNKLCLRESVREGASVRKTLIAVVSSWDSADIAALEKLLQERRACFGESRQQITARIRAMVSLRVPAGRQWRLLQGRPAPRLGKKSA